MKYGYALLLLSITMIFCSNRSGGGPIKIPIAYHFLYDSAKYDPSYLKHDLKFLNIEHDGLNNKFQGKIKFIDPIVRTHFFNKSLYDIYLNYSESDGNYIKYLIDTWSIKGYLNVFVLRTETVNGYVLNGFTPNEDYVESVFNSPQHDNVYISFDALFEYTTGATLAHEIGHWLTLKHPWQGQMTLAEQYNMGLYSQDIICTNIMNYNCYVEKFTKQQIDSMVLACEKYRYYLTRD